MTFKEKWMQDHPGHAFDPVCRCPSMFGYEPEGVNCANPKKISDMTRVCGECWNREMPENANVTLLPYTPGNIAYGTIKDSGERRQFETGAVRDIQEGKGRCDLMPLRVLARIWRTFDTAVQDIGVDKAKVFDHIADFQDSGDTKHLELAIHHFVGYLDYPTAFLEVAKHFEEGAKKYGENNWQKGLPVKCYIDSAVRHYLKWLRGDKDEPHDRAFVWNLMCCIWEIDFSPRAMMEGMPVAEEGRKPSVAYICDRTQCDGGCPNPDCHHTEDVRHAKNFESAPGAKGTVYIERVPELTNAIAKNPQITLEDCPIGLFRLDEKLYVKTNAHYEHNSICVIPVDNGVGVAIENTRMVTPTKIRSYAVSEQKVAACGIKSGFVELNDEIWLLCRYTRNTYMRDAYSINSGKSVTLISADMVRRVEVYEYE